MKKVMLTIMAVLMVLGFSGMVMAQQQDCNLTYCSNIYNNGTNSTICLNQMPDPCGECVFNNGTYKNLQLDEYYCLEAITPGTIPELTTIGIGAAIIAGGAAYILLAKKKQV
jgi:hypothetical protein